MKQIPFNVELAFFQELQAQLPLLVAQLSGDEEANVTTQSGWRHKVGGVSTGRVVVITDGP